MWIGRVGMHYSLCHQALPPKYATFFCTAGMASRRAPDYCGQEEEGWSSLGVMVVMVMVVVLEEVEVVVVGEC